MAELHDGGKPLLIIFMTVKLSISGYDHESNLSGIQIKGEGIYRKNEKEKWGLGRFVSR